MERGHIHFPEEVMLTQKGKKCCFPAPVPRKLKILCSYCFQKKRASMEFRIPPLQATALSSKESG